MSGFFQERRLFADGAKVIFQLGWTVEQLLACIALVSPGFSRLRHADRVWAGSDHESISKEEIAVLAIALSHFLLLDPTVLLDFRK